MDTFATPLVELDVRIFDDVQISRATVAVARSLAELKGVTFAIPDQAIIAQALIVQEARASAALDHIVTSFDEIFQSDVVAEGDRNPGARKVLSCIRALNVGYSAVQRMRQLAIADVLEIQQEVEAQGATPTSPSGSHSTTETQRPARRSRREPERMMTELRDIEQFMHSVPWSYADPLLRMAVLHRQFLSIQAFPGGNGRTGRIVNVLYLVLNGLLDSPVLSLSPQIVRTRAEYTRAPDARVVEAEWKLWVMYMLRLVDLAAEDTMRTMLEIRRVVADYRERIPKGHRFCSPELVDALFLHPCMKIEILMKELRVSRITATKYLEALAADGVLRKERVGRSSCYINVGLVQVLTLADEHQPEVPERDEDARPGE